MELTIAVVISILSITFTILNFAFSRKDKSNSTAKDESYKWGQIDAKLQNIEEFMKKIEKKLDSYDTEIDDKIEKAIENHIKQYHGNR